MIEIEFEEPQVSTCECCGGITTRLTRFVYQDGDAFAVYYIMFTDSHDDKYIEGLVGLGEWGEGSDPGDRTAFPFRIWTEGDNYQVGLTDAADSPWRDVNFLGQILDREQGLQHHLIKDVFHITDHIVLEDKTVIGFFSE